VNYLFPTALFIHIVGITCIAGGSIGGLLLEKYIWKNVRESPEKVHVLGPLMSQYPVIIQVGTLLMLVSGLMMFEALGWVVAGQWWFIVKMIFVVALVLNGTLIAKPNGAKLLMLVPRLVNGENVKVEIAQVKKT